MTSRHRNLTDLRACRVLVTSTTFGIQDPALRSRLEQEVGEVRYNLEKRPLKAPELTHLVIGIDGWIAGIDEIDASVMAAADRLKVIARYGVGFDRVDVAAATKRGIVVTNTPGANSAAVAELTIGLMLALGRQICQSDQAVRRGQWPRYSGRGLGQNRGLGGVRVHRPRSRPSSRGLPVPRSCRGSICEPGRGLRMRGQPCVSRRTPSGLRFCMPACGIHPETAGMVNDSFLRKMRSGAFLVNTARGELIDEAALRQSLKAVGCAGPHWIASAKSRRAPIIPCSSYRR